MTKEKEMTFTLSGGRKVTMLVTTNWTHDPNYGADADGNRGVSTWFLDDIFFVVPEEDNDGTPLSKEDIEMLKQQGHERDYEPYGEIWWITKIKLR